MQSWHFICFVRFYPAKHTTLILSKPKKIPERAPVGAHEAREQTISIHGISWGQTLRF